LAEALNKKGVRTVQNTDINDKDFMSAYSRSINSAQKLLKDNPTIRILIDLHRDGLPPEVGKAVVKFEDRDMAKILFVVGQKNNHWEKNNQLVEKIISIGNQKYPGLFSENPSYAIEARYNQHLSNGAILLEVGSQLNTPQEALNSVDPLAEVLKDCLQK
jgi:stage II sporulation protein P